MCETVYSIKNRAMSAEGYMGCIDSKYSAFGIGKPIPETEVVSEGLEQLWGWNLVSEEGILGASRWHGS